MTRLRCRRGSEDRSKCLKYLLWRWEERQQHLGRINWPKTHPATVMKDKQKEIKIRHLPITDTDTVGVNQIQSESNVEGAQMGVGCTGHGGRRLYNTRAVSVVARRSKGQGRREQEVQVETQRSPASFCWTASGWPVSYCKGGVGLDGKEVRLPWKVQFWHSGGACPQEASEAKTSLEHLGNDRALDPFLSLWIINRECCRVYYVTLIFILSWMEADRQGREIMVAKMGNRVDQETAPRQFCICVF